MYILKIHILNIINGPCYIYVSLVLVPYLVLSIDKAKVILLTKSCLF